MCEEITGVLARDLDAIGRGGVLFRLMVEVTLWHACADPEVFLYVLAVECDGRGEVCESLDVFGLE